MEHESDGDTNCNWCARYSHQRISTGNGGLGNERTSGELPNSNIDEISQNTVKSPELEETCRGKPSANIGVKNLKRVKKKYAKIDISSILLSILPKDFEC